MTVVTASKILKWKNFIMFRFFKKYKLQFDILAVLFWCFLAVSAFFFDHQAEKKNYYLFFGIISTLSMIFKISDVIEGIRKKKVG